MSGRKDDQGRMRDATGQPKREVPRYARRLGWNVTGLPDHGAINDLLARIIDTVERKGLHLGRWGGNFTATYAVFDGKSRPRSYSRHGALWMHTKEGGGVTMESEACRDLLAYEEELRGMADPEWAEVRMRLREREAPRRRRRAAGLGTGPDGTGFAPDAKPCGKLGYCPYGSLVEQFPLPSPGDQRGCDRFGHLCPVFIAAERIGGVRNGSEAAQGTATASV